MALVSTIAQTTQHIVPNEPGSRRSAGKDNFSDSGSTSTIFFSITDTFSSFAADGGNATNASNVGYKVVMQWWQQEQIIGWSKYCSIVLIVIGTVGNLLAALTLQSRVFNKTGSTRFLLTMLALADVLTVNTILWNVFLNYNFNIDYSNMTSFGCKVTYFSAYSGRYLTVWTLILLTFERTISVYFPFTCKQICSRRRVVAAWLVMWSGVVAVDFQFFFSLDLKHGTDGVFRCDTTSEYWSWFISSGLFFWIDSAIGDLVPVILVFIGNISIISKLVIARRERLNQMQGGGSHDLEGMCNGKNITDGGNVTRKRGRSGNTIGAKINPGKNGNSSHRQLGFCLP